MGQRVGGAKPLAKQLTEKAEKVVAQGAAVDLNIGLEMIDLDGDEGEGPAVPFGAGKFGGQAGLKMALVEQAGGGVADGVLAKQAVGGFEFGDLALQFGNPGFVVPDPPDSGEGLAGELGGLTGVFNGLDQVFVGSAAQGHDGGVERIGVGDQDDLGVGAGVLDPLQQPYDAGAGLDGVGKDHGTGVGHEEVEALLRGVRFVHLKPFCGQGLGQGRADGRFVFHDQDAGCGFVSSQRSILRKNKSHCKINSEFLLIDKNYARLIPCFSS